MNQLPPAVLAKDRTPCSFSIHGAATNVLDKRRLAEWADHSTHGSHQTSSADQLDFELDLRALARRARALYDMRRLRSNFFDQSLFGEPAWDILLDLFIAFANRQRISTTSCCIASAAPTSTALRWIGELSQTGLVWREPSSTDRRSSYVSLTHEGVITVAQFLTSLDN